MDTEKFRKDHVSILGNVTDLRALVQRGVAEHADMIAKAIVSMSAAIKMHLASEDRTLYPALAGSNNPDAARIGKAFQHEMGGIAAAYGEFAASWNIGAKIAANPDGFKSHANDIFKALHQRIQREHQELYPAAEKI